MQVCLTLPTPVAPDMARRIVTFSIDGGEVLEQTLGSNAVKSNAFEVKRGSVVKGTLVDMDTSGNQSVPRDYEIQVKDMTAPPQPGEVSFMVLDEADAEVVDPVEPVEPEVTPEV